MSPVLGDVPVAKGNKKYGEGGKTLVRDLMMRVKKPYKRIYIYRSKKSRTKIPHVPSQATASRGWALYCTNTWGQTHRSRCI